MELCGDDFLAALAESMEDSEEWDNVQDADLEAPGKMFEEEEVVNHGLNVDTDIHVIEDSPVALPQKYQNFVELDSSSDSDSNFRIRKRKGVVTTPSSRSDLPSFGFAQSSGKYSSGSLVRTELGKCYFSLISLLLLALCNYVFLFFRVSWQFVV